MYTHIHPHIHKCTHTYTHTHTHTHTPTHTHTQPHTSPKNIPSFWRPWQHPTHKFDHPSLQIPKYYHHLTSLRRKRRPYDRAVRRVVSVLPRPIYDRWNPLSRRREGLRMHRYECVYVCMYVSGIFRAGGDKACVYTCVCACMHVYECVYICIYGRWNPLSRRREDRPVCIHVCMYVYEWNLTSRRGEGLCVYMNVCMHMSVYEFVCLHVCGMYVFMITCIHSCMYVRLHVCIIKITRKPVCMYVCMDGCLYVYMHVCMYVCISSV